MASKHDKANPSYAGLMMTALLICRHVYAAPAEVIAKVHFVTCALADLKADARCGALSVPENPDRGNSRRIDIHFVLVPAKGKGGPDPIVPLMGGPGEDAISNAAFYAKQFDALREHRDLLLIDQRGTGTSSPLRCNLYSARHPEQSLRDVFPADRAAHCEASLSHHADLAQYGYLRFAGDLEHVRTALGYDSFNLYAGSYGTRAAQVFMRGYPRSVRTAFLGSVVPIDIAQPLPMAQTAQDAFMKLFDTCAAEPTCGTAFPNLRSEFEQIEQQLQNGRDVNLPDRAGKATLSGGRVTEWLR